MATFEDFEQYWAHFVREHSASSGRLIDLAGLGAAALSLAAGLTSRRRRWLVLAAPLLAAVPALAHHAAAGGDSPLTPRRLWWWLRADLRLAGKTLAGTMAAELERCRRAAPGGSRADDLVRATVVVEIFEHVEEQAVDPQSLN